MAESGSYNLGFRFDIKQILLEAKHRWLRPAEICEILRNYEKFHISTEAPNKPVSGSVFLFDRKVLRYFRKDGHNWRKKKDGKTVKEAHEKLKVGSVDMLHCYYAHGEDNENFQRRSYWLLEPELMHIVFVHYLEVKGNKTNLSGVRNSDRISSNSENDVSMSSGFCGTSPASHLSSAYDDAESVGSHQASSRFHLYPESALADDGHSAQSSSYDELFNPVNQNAPALNYASVSRSHTDEGFGGGILLTGTQATVDLASTIEYTGIIAGENAYKPEYMGSVPVHSHWQVLNNSIEDKHASSGQGYSQQKEQLGQRSFQVLPSNVEPGNAVDQNLENSMTAIGNENHSFLLKKPLISGLQTDESLKKVDSFSRWIAKEFGDADELDVQSSNGISWSIMASEDESTIISQLQADHTLNPSISQDQLFSIIEFSPNWAYANLETKVLVTGVFLKGEQEMYSCRWSIMFGEVEVPADVLGDGILCCSSPLQNPGLVPFYVTCSNRLACSEIRDFEYKSEQNVHSLNVNEDRGAVMHLYERFDKILGLEPSGSPVHFARSDHEKQSMINKIISLIDEDGDQGIRLISENYMSQLVVIGELLLVKQLKEKFFSWLVHRVAEDGKGPMIIDAGGQGVLHLAAALGFNWVFQPMITAGVSIDFRDVNGWTALHWSAFCGREETVVALVSFGAAPGSVLDPNSEYPLGRTPADLASSSGHKGISGYLAEGSLTKQLTTLTVKDNVISEASGSDAIQTLSERSAVATTEEDVPETLSLKDSLAAICNAMQAAARIKQIFRIQSFQRRQLTEGGSDGMLTPEAQAVSLAVKSSRLGHSDGMVDAAALRIQKKYRGWKTRKEFLQIRQKIVKIQAHVRGHQVRKKYKPIIWSVGILEKVILRWRRKGSGLRGFRSGLVQKGPSTQETMPTQEDDYDFLKEGRKQTEERMHKALDRVKSMVQYPEARDQYRRLLNAAQEFRETKDASDMISDNIDMNYPEEDQLDVSSLLDDDTVMSLAFL